MKIYVGFSCVAALMLVAGAATAQACAGPPPAYQAPKAGQMEHHEMQAPMGRPQPEQPMMPEMQEAVPQARPSARPGAQGRGMCPCPMCEMGRGRGQAFNMMEMRMKQAGLPDETITRARMLMRAQVHPADPQALLALKDELNLTPEQVSSLESLVDSAQERALGVLDNNQWQQIRQLRPQAASMMEMHSTIMPMMRAMGQGRGGMMGDRMKEKEQLPYGRPEGGSLQQPPAGEMKPECR